MRKYFLIFLLCLIPVNLHAAYKQNFACTSLTGGTVGALDYYTTSQLHEGDETHCNVSGEVYHFRFDVDGTNAENTATHPYYVRPDDYSSGGVWVEQGAGYSIETDPIVGAVNGIVKADGGGNISAATLSDADIPNDITIDNLNQVQTRDATTLNGNNWKVLYINGTGDVTELSLGSANTVLTSSGAASAPSFSSGSSLWTDDGSFIYPNTGASSIRIYDANKINLGDVSTSPPDDDTIFISAAPRTYSASKINYAMENQLLVLDFSADSTDRRAFGAQFGALATGGAEDISVLNGFVKQESAGHTGNIFAGNLMTTFSGGSITSAIGLEIDMNTEGGTINNELRGLWVTGRLNPNACDTTFTGQRTAIHIDTAQDDPGAGTCEGPSDINWTRGIDVNYTNTGIWFGSNAGVEIAQSDSGNPDFDLDAGANLILTYDSQKASPSHGFFIRVGSADTDVFNINSSGQVKIEQELNVGDPGGGWKGSGSINVDGSVYSDGSVYQLADYVYESWKGKLDIDKWNEKKRSYLREKRDRKDKKHGLNRKRMTDSEIESEEHEYVKRFNPEMFDLDKFYAFIEQNEHLPAMPSGQEWDQEKNFGINDLLNRLIETVEVQSIHIHKLNERLKILEMKP